MDQPSDIASINRMTYLFVLLTLLNISFTFVLYFNAKNIDMSKVETPSYSESSNFEILSENRTSSEIKVLILTLLILTLGLYGAYKQSGEYLSLFCLLLLLNLILTAPMYLLYYYYAIRYMIDLLLIFTGHHLKSKLSFHYLPLRIHVN